MLREKKRQEMKSSIQGSTFMTLCQKTEAKKKKMEKKLFFKKRTKYCQDLKRDMSLSNMMNEARFMLETIIMKFRTPHI